MADRILYSIPEMKQAGANFHAKAEEINDILNYLNSEIENLESVFDGAAQDSLFAKYQQLQQSLKQFPEVVDNLGSLIENIAQQVEQNDQDMASSISSN